MISSCYIHIPFCDDICSYCDFCKMYTNRRMIHDYLNRLSLEIEERYQGEVMKTIYIGGGTPSALTKEELKTLFELLKQIKREENLEFTMECNIESLSKEKLVMMKEYGVNRISLGIQTIDEESIVKLNRHHTKEMVESKINEIKEMGFQNINVDLMYAFPWETKEQFQRDLDFFISLDVPHISTYSLIIEDHTVFGIRNLKPLDEQMDVWMYETLKEVCKKHNYSHYEVSNFARPGYESKHNLVYWNNERYYGFGLGASGYIKDTRYENTRNISKYLSGDYVLESHTVSDVEDMENECILGLRKMEGISKDTFYRKFHKHIEEVFPVQSLLSKKLLEEENGYLYIPEDKIYISNEILTEFID